MTQNDFGIYSSLCAQVYDLRVPCIEDDIYAFYKSFAIDAGGPILEPMCGTGRFLLPLLKEGFDIYGFDASQHMLDELWKKAIQQNLAPNVWQSFAQDFSLDKKFNLIFLPFSSFGLITDLGTVRTVLENFYKNLNHGGKFIFEVDTTSTTSHIGQDRVSYFSISSDKTIKVTSKDLPIENSVMRCMVQYDLEESQKIVYTEVENYRLRLYSLSQIGVLLQESGFTRIKFHKAFARDIAPHEHDGALVVECMK